jgi:hypothetical protein
VRVAMAASFSAPGLLRRKKKKTRESDREISSYIYISTQNLHTMKNRLYKYMYMPTIARPKAKSTGRAYFYYYEKVKTSKYTCLAARARSFFAFS